MKTLRDRTSALLLGVSLCGLASLAAAAPTVSLSAPANAALYLAPATLAVSASVTPSAGTTIARVDFYQGSTLIGTDTTTPYSVTWSNAPAGTYSLTAKATDSAGGVTTSAARTITVNASNTLPTVSLSAPPANASYLAPASVTLTASASGVEVNTPISKIEFLDGSTVLATLTGTPYTYAWANLPVGAHSLTARATDSAGGVTTTAPRTITVNASNTPPTVSLTAPANNASYTLPVSITLSASASGVEVNTPISQIEFYQGTTRVGTATASPYSVLWTPPAAGSYSLTAKATDSAGGVTTSAPRSVTIQPAAAAQVYYLHTDHLNTPRLVTDETNTVLWRATPVSEPFGMGPPEEDPDQNGTPFTLNLRFPGQYFDKESNLNYNYFRDYNPQTGRYVESDPIGLQGGINTYGYVGGNPLSYVDPNGLQISIPAPGFGPAVGSLVRPGTLIDPIAIPGPPDPNDDKSGQRCGNLEKRIKNLKDEIYNKRYPDLQANPNNLPQRIGPGEALRETIRGHETLLNRQLRRLRELEDQYDKECTC